MPLFPEIERIIVLVYTLKIISKTLHLYICRWNPFLADLIDISKREFVPANFVAFVWIMHYSLLRGRILLKDQKQTNKKKNKTKQQKKKKKKTPRSLSEYKLTPNIQYEL